MTNTKQKVVEMVADGKVTADEGKQLLNAMDPPSKLKRWMIIYNPFPSVSVATGLFLAALAVLAGFGVALLGVRFDGALDLHLAPTNLSEAALDAANSWFTTVVVFWLASLIVARQGRIIDFLIAVGIARWPIVLAGLALGGIFSYPASLVEQAETNPNSPMLILAALIVLPAIVWMMTLLFHGFKYASGLRGGRLTVTFIVAIVVAEILSKVVLGLVA